MRVSTHWPGCGDTGEAKHKGCKKTHEIWPGGWMGRRNRIKCLHCEDVIEATNEHDFKYCTCGKVGIDGGFRGHWRRLGGQENYKEMP